MSCTSRPANAIPPGGQGTPETGITSRWSSSTRSGIRSPSKRRHPHGIKRLGAHESGDNYLDTHRGQPGHCAARRLVIYSRLDSFFASAKSQRTYHLSFVGPSNRIESEIGLGPRSRMPNPLAFAVGVRWEYLFRMLFCMHLPSAVQICLAQCLNSQL